MGYISIKPESAQGQLWAVTTIKQQTEIAAMFRHLKRDSQTQLAYILLDYIEDGVVPEFTEDEMLLSAAFVFLTGYGLDSNAKWHIRPKSHQQEDPAPHKPTLREKIYDLFPSFKKSLCI